MSNPCDKGRPRKSPPPPEAGTYRIRDAEDRPKYIGATNNLERRAKEHEKSGLYDPAGGDTMEHQRYRPGTTPTE